MAQVVNYYKRMGAFGKNHYYNPHAKDGALIHPFRAIISAPSGNYKSNTCLNIINTCACFEKIYLVSANGKTEPLYVFLKSKLGDKLKIIEDIADLPRLKTDTKGAKKKGKKKTKEKKDRPGSEGSDSEEMAGSEAESGSGSGSESEKEAEAEGSGEEEENSKPSSIEGNLGKHQRLIIFEDQVFEGKKRLELINTWFCRSRNANFSVILTTQHWFSVPRSTRIQANYCIFLKLSNMKEIKSILKDFAIPLNPDQFLKAYEYATKDPGSFLMLDLVDRDPQHRLRKDFSEAIVSAR